MGEAEDKDVARAVAGRGTNRSSRDFNPPSAQHRPTTSDGTYRWFQVRKRPLRDPNGRIVRWYALHVDIDDQKRAEEALRESERNFKTTIDTTQRWRGRLVQTVQPNSLASFNGTSGFGTDFIDRYVKITGGNPPNGWWISAGPVCHLESGCWSEFLGALLVLAWRFSAEIGSAMARAGRRQRQGANLYPFVFNVLSAEAG